MSQTVTSQTVVVAPWLRTLKIQYAVDAKSIVKLNNWYDYSQDPDPLEGLIFKHGEGWRVYGEQFKKEYLGWYSDFNVAEGILTEHFKTIS